MMLNENIRNIRKEKGMTQEQLAEAMGVSTASVSKWETAQSAPEVEMLMELADFFETSVDALLGHKVSADRKQALLDAMESLAKENRFAQAKEMGQKLLRNYPNDYDVVSQVADIYYRSYVTDNGNSERDMEYSIELTKRLFALLDDPTGMKRFNLLSRLGNQYELLRNWDMARKYYNDSNAFAANNSALARILIEEGRNREAADAITKEFTQELFNLLLDAMSLHTVWRELGEQDKAEAVLDWAISMLKSAGKGIAESYAPMLVILYVQKLAAAKNRGDEAGAKSCAEAAIALIENREENTSPDFLTGNHKELLISNNLKTPESIRQLLETNGAEQRVTLTSSRK